MPYIPHSEQIAEYEAAAARRPRAVRAWPRAAAFFPSGAAPWAPITPPPRPGRAPPPGAGLYHPLLRMMMLLNQ